MTKEIHDYLTGEGDGVSDVSPQERLNVIKEHLDLLIKEKGEYIAIREMRKHICWYVKNLKDASKLKQEVTRLESREDVEKCLAEYFDNI